MNIVGNVMNQEPIAFAQRVNDRTMKNVPSMLKVKQFLMDGHAHNVKVYNEPIIYLRKCNFYPFSH